MREIEKLQVLVSMSLSELNGVYFRHEYGINWGITACEPEIVAVDVTSPRRQIAPLRGTLYPPRNET